MSANDFTRFFIESGFEELSVARKAATERVHRLLRSTFEDPERAIGAYDGLLEARGLEGTLGVLQSDDFFGRHWHFGWMRGGLFARGNRQKAREALDELPSAIRAHYELTMRERDLERVLRDERAREDDERLRSAATQERQKDR
ncbi:hypothetical protein ACQQ2Q_22290, partial [Agrobacterium sp. ES01]|uniref:hypothetical protein n=1 Tax=Agrobacterium sp. ES01 TaxID=3420714 RepID=UPI003D0F40F3